MGHNSAMSVLCSTEKSMPAVASGSPIGGVLFKAKHLVEVLLFALGFLKIE
jgi:hypothetical protein